MRSAAAAATCFLVVFPGCAGWVASTSERSAMGSIARIPETDWKRYDLGVLRDKEIPQVLLSARNAYDWPLMIALWNEAGRGLDCRPKDTFRCLRGAALRHQPAYAYRTVFGQDSAVGWGAASREDGSIIIFRFDGSPSGQVLPQRAGWQLDYTVCKQLAGKMLASEFLCANPRFGR